MPDLQRRPLQLLDLVEVLLREALDGGGASLGLPLGRVRGGRLRRARVLLLGPPAGGAEPAQLPTRQLDLALRLGDFGLGAGALGAGATLTLARRIDRLLRFGQPRLVPRHLRLCRGARCLGSRLVFLADRQRRVGLDRGVAQSGQLLLGLTLAQRPVRAVAAHRI